MDPKQGSSHSGERKNLKRKLADSACPSGSEDSRALATAEVQAHIAVLKGSLTWREADRVAARKAAHAIAELAKHEEHVDAIVEEGAIHALVPHLSAPAVEEGDGPIACEHEVEKDAAFALGLLAIKPDHQRLIADSGALTALVALLKRRPGQPPAASAAAAPASAPTALGLAPAGTTDGAAAGGAHVGGAGGAGAGAGGVGAEGGAGASPAVARVVNGVVRRAADAITNLAHENGTIKSRVRAEGGIPPLVELLESLDPKVQRAGAGALRTLAFLSALSLTLCPPSPLVVHVRVCMEAWMMQGGGRNTTAGGAAGVAGPQVECGALPTLIFMLRSEDTGIHYEAVGVIGNLVHSSMNIKKLVLDEGALQPVIGLLSSRCTESQREAALLLGQFATTDPECKVRIVQRGAVRIVQRGAVRPLITMLEAPDPQLREMAAFALGRLAQNADNQAGIVHDGGLRPLLELLESKNGNLQHNAAFALYGLAENGTPTFPHSGCRQDNVSEVVREGGVQRLVGVPTGPDNMLEVMREEGVQRLVDAELIVQTSKATSGGSQLHHLLHAIDLTWEGPPAMHSLRPNASTHSLFHPHPTPTRTPPPPIGRRQDNVSEVVREGGVQRLVDAELIVQASKDCVQKTLKRLEEKMEGKVLRHLLYLLRQSDKSVQRRVAAALAHLCPEGQQRAIFVGAGGLDILLAMLASPPSPRLQRDAAVALRTLSKRATTLNPIDTAPPPPTPQVAAPPTLLLSCCTLPAFPFLFPSSPAAQVYLGEQYVNCPTLSDVTFLVEGTRFYAHRIALLASSDAFRAMFDGGYRQEEKEAKDIEIPNISLPVFESMMRCIYTGAVEVRPEMAQDLLRAADQYLLETLKRLCEHAIAQDLTVENVANVYELAETYHAQSLRQMCVLFVLDHHEQMCNLPGYNALLQRMVPETREYISRVLRPRLP
ncbi:unnamed protein product [Closterium sp. NIES-64]|nr:unnamed protein product [Closterium sp. NIES-64]